MEIIEAEPLLTSYISIAEHQSRTPESFYSGPLVLYHLAKASRLAIDENDLLHNSPALLELATVFETNVATSHWHTVGSTARDVSMEGVDVWVTSDKLILYRSRVSKGLSLTYPTISLHAIQTLPADSSSQDPPAQGLYLQLALSDPLDDPDADSASLALTIIPDSDLSNIYPPNPVDPPETNGSAQDEPIKPIQALFNAVSACANLHPDPVSPGSEEEDGDEGYVGGESARERVGEAQILGGQDGLPPAMPGSGVWITTDNVGDHFDEEGNWRGQWLQPLGPGAGTVRERGGEDGVDGAEEEDELKWRRTG